MPYSTVARIRNTDPLSDKIRSIGSIVDAFRQSREARRGRRTDEAKQDLDLLLQVASSWGPQQWARNRAGLEQKMAEAGYDPDVINPVLNHMERQSSAAVGQAESKAAAEAASSGLLSQAFKTGGEHDLDPEMVWQRGLQYLQPSHLTGALEAGKLAGFGTEVPEPAAPKEPTGELRTFTEIFLPGYLEANKLDLTPVTKMQAWEAFQELGMRPAGAGGAAAPSKHAGLADAIMDADPETGRAIYNTLTPSAKTAISAELAERGFQGFGRSVSETGLRRVAETRGAISQIEKLRSSIDKYQQYVGPIAGLQTHIPHSEARKVLADIDRVRQIVGKALEGGVLRKEDEEKYKRILPVATDTVSTALYKIEQILDALRTDTDIFLKTQGAAGRDVSGFGDEGEDRDDEVLETLRNLVDRVRKRQGEAGAGVD